MNSVHFICSVNIFVKWVLQNEKSANGKKKGDGF